MPSRKRTFYLKLQTANEAVIDTALDLIETEQDRLYRRLMAELPTTPRRFRVFDTETGKWVDL